MSLKYIRKRYGVPAKRGGKILYMGKPGKIVSAKGAYLRIKMDNYKLVETYHPTYRITYL